MAQKLSWLVAAILVLLPFHALLTTWGGSNFGHLDVWRVWKEILLISAAPFIIFIALSDKSRRRWFIHSPIVNLFRAYVFLYVILGVWAYTHNTVNKTALAYSLIINLRFLFFFVFCAILTSASPFLKNNWRKILLAPAGVVVVFGLIQKLLLPLDFLRHFGYGKNTIPAYQTVDANLEYRRIQSTLRGANPLGAYLVLIIPAFWPCVKRVWLKYLAFAAGLVILFYTYSRSAEIGTAIALGLLFWWTSGRKFTPKKVAVVLIGLAIAVAGLAFVFKNSQVLQDTLFHTSNSSTSQQSSNASRLQAMKNGVSDIVHQPLGRGPGTAGPASTRNNHPPRIAENYFLQIGQEVGVIGMGLFITINCMVAKLLWTRRSDQLAKILLASLVGITFVNLLSHAWTDDTLAYLWWGLAGIALSPLLAKNKRKGYD